MNIPEMQSQCLGWLKELYPLTNFKLEALKIDDQTLSSSSYNFMLAEHSKGVRSYCNKNDAIITFRDAGIDTLKWIKEGNPCKGHDIMDKTIKKKSDGNLTYNAHSNNTITSSLYGLVGHANGKGNYLDGIWALNDNVSSVVNIDYVKSTELNQYYTGDYDMHDLIVKGKRVLSGTSTEASIINNINAALFENDSIRLKKINSLFKGRFSKSPYSLVRHGAQTSFMSFLLSGSSTNELSKAINKMKTNNAPVNIPYSDSIIKIGSGVLAFDETGAAYYLKSPKDVYGFYVKKNILSQIPFYYFFQELEAKGYQSQVTGYQEYIFGLLDQVTKEY